MLHRNGMFTRYSPRFRFITTPEEEATAAAAAAAAAATPPADTPPADLGYPLNTAVAEMTDAQQAAYWKNYSRKHEREATNAKLEVATRDTRIGELEAQTQSDADKALTAARKEGETSGANRYLADAVSGRLEAITGKNPEELAAALELIDVTKLALPEGGLDHAKITAFAGTLATKAPADSDVPPTDPVLAALQRQQQQPAGQRGGGSIADMQKQIIDRHNGGSAK